MRLLQQAQLDCMLPDCVMGGGDQFPEETGTAGQTPLIAKFDVVVTYHRYTAWSQMCHFRAIYDACASCVGTQCILDGDAAWASCSC